MKVAGIATQGRHDADQWVTAYYVYYSSDGVNFAKVKHWWNYVKVKFYNSNFHAIDIVFVAWKLFKFLPWIEGRKMKIKFLLIDRV